MNMELESHPAAELTMRYEYYSALVKAWNTAAASVLRS